MVEPAPLVAMAGLEPALDAQSARVEHSGGACGACMAFEGVGAGGQCQADSPFAPRVIRNGKALNPNTVRHVEDLHLREWLLRAWCFTCPIYAVFPHA